MTELFCMMSNCWPAVMEILPALPGPVLLAETVAPFEIVTDCPAVRAMLPPEPASGEMAVELLKMPTEEPSLSRPDIEMVSLALIVMNPPFPVLLVPLSI